MSPAKSTAKKTKKVMSSEHKAALAVGRQSGNAVRRYLEALESNRPKRGRKRTPDSIAARLKAVNEELASASAIKRLNLLQEKENLEAELATPTETIDLASLEKEFAAHAAAYGQSKGISYATWRAMGVPAPLLTQAGISRGAR